MKRKSARKTTKATVKSSAVTRAKDPSDSSVVQFGVAFIVVASFALLAYSIKAFVPTP